MPTRRQEKVARIVKEVVSDAITNHLSDPRIKGIVSVTRVDMATDLRAAEVYLSIFENEPEEPQDDRQNRQADARKSRTLEAITHAKSRIQAMLADRLQAKFCPTLRFRTDDRFKKTLEIFKLIEQTACEAEERDSPNHDLE
jgi:ribosome-binding factor A